MRGCNYIRHLITCKNAITRIDGEFCFFHPHLFLNSWLPCIFLVPSVPWKLPHGKLEHGCCWSVGPVILGNWANLQGCDVWGCLLLVGCWISPQTSSVSILSLSGIGWITFSFLYLRCISHPDFNDLLTCLLLQWECPVPCPASHQKDLPFLILLLSVSFLATDEGREKWEESFWIEGRKKNWQKVQRPLGCECDLQLCQLLWELETDCSVVHWCIEFLGSGVVVVKYKLWQK